MKIFFDILFIGFLLIYCETNAQAQIDDLFPGLQYRMLAQPAEAGLQL